MVELIEPLETELHGKWKAIDDEKERIKKEKEEAEQAALLTRINEIQELGMSFKDGFYQIGETITVDVATLRSMPDDMYAKLKTAITNKAAEIQKARELEEEKRREEKAEQDRQAEQLRQEQQKLQAERDELEKQKRELEQQKIEAEKSKRYNRTNSLAAIGMSYDEREKVFVFDNGFSAVKKDAEEIFDGNTAKFDEQKSELEALIKQSRDRKAQHDEEKKREQESLDAKKKLIAELFEKVAGMSFSYTAQAFTWEDKNTALSVPFGNLVHLSDDELRKKAETTAQEIADAKKMTKDHDDKVAEQQRQEQQAALGDKERYDQFHEAICEAATKLVPEQFKTKKYQQRAGSFLERLTNLLKEFQ